MKLQNSVLKTVLLAATLLTTSYSAQAQDNVVNLCGTFVSRSEILTTQEFGIGAVSQMLDFDGAKKSTCETEDAVYLIGEFSSDRRRIIQFFKEKPKVPVSNTYDNISCVKSISEVRCNQSGSNGVYFNACKAVSLVQKLDGTSEVIQLSGSGSGSMEVDPSIAILTLGGSAATEYFRAKGQASKDALFSIGTDIERLKLLPVCQTQN